MRRSFVITAGLIAAVAVTFLSRAGMEWPVASTTGAVAIAAPMGTEDRGGSGLPVTTIVARRSDAYRIESRYAGEIVARRTSALGFSRGGILDQVNVDDGDHVTAGQLLASLDVRALRAKAEELRSAIDRNRSLLEVAAARSEQAAALEKRRSALARKDYVSREAFEDAIFGYKMALAERDAAEGAIRTAQASLDALRVDLDLSRLTAPYDGTIVIRRRDEGAAVAVGEPVLEIAETDNVEFRVGVPAPVASTLSIDGEYRGVFGDRETRCRLRRIIPRVETETRTVTIVLTLPADFPPPRPGELGHLLLDRDVTASGFWLPLSAMTESRRGLWAAFVVEPPPGGTATGDTDTGIVTLRNLQLIQVEGDRAFVTGVLTDGDRVVADGAHRLTPGMRVTVVSDPSGGAAGRDRPPEAPRR